MRLSSLQIGSTGDMLRINPSGIVTAVSGPSLVCEPRLLIPQHLSVDRGTVELRLHSKPSLSA